MAQIFTINPFVADVLHDLRDGRPVVYSEDLPTQMRQKRAVAGFIGASEEMRTEIMAAILLHEQWEEAAEQREAEKQLEWD